MKEMEKLPEGRPQFPAHWKFPGKDSMEKGTLNAKVVQAERDFLAISLNPDLSMTTRDQKDYLFDQEGNVVVEKSTYVDRGENLSIINITNVERDMATHLFVHGDNRDSNFLTIFGFDHVGDNGMIAGYPFGSVSFTKGKLTDVVMGGLFDVDMEGKKIPSPECRLSFDEDGSPRMTLLSTVFDLVRVRSNPIYTSMADGGYKLSWGPKDDGNFFLKQEDFETGTIKILEAPMELDMESLGKVALAEPPYEKQKIGGRESLNIPWRDIGNILGVTLSYSHPISQDLQEEKVEKEEN